MFVHIDIDICILIVIVRRLIYFNGMSTRLELFYA